jgi:hypothetical protein
MHFHSVRVIFSPIWWPRSHNGTALSLISPLMRQHIGGTFLGSVEQFIALYYCII